MLLLLQHLATPNLKLLDLSDAFPLRDGDVFLTLLCQGPMTGG